jgi:hypothetical protein
MKKPITLTLRTDVIAALDAAADAAMRSRSGLADLLIARGLEGLQFMPAPRQLPDAPEARAA